MLAATLGASLLGNMVAGRRIKSKIPEHEETRPELGVIPAAEGITRSG